MNLDQHRNPMTGGSDAVALYDRAIDELLRYRPGVVDLSTRLVEDHPDAAMGHALLGYLTLSSSDQTDVAAAADLGAAALGAARNDREVAHATTVLTWASGDWHGAAAMLDELLVQWPADLLALVIGHLLDFYLGDAANLRDRVARSRPAVDPEHSHHGLVTGMFAFGLEESGTYDRALAAGLEALERNPDDVWAVHAVAHTHEMRGDVDAGIRFMTERIPDWGSGNLFTVHNWWHLALYHLEAGDIPGVLRIYDTEVHHGDSAPVSLELLDASAMLWRLRLDGVDVGPRFDELARAWDDWDTGIAWYSFNDLHAVVARCGAGRFDDAEATVERLESYVASGGSGSNVSTTARVALPASRGVLAHAQGRHDDAVAELAALPRIAADFGGSHAQRDLLVRTLTDSAIRSGHLDLARGLLAQRLELRPSSTWGLGRRAWLLREAGDPAGATEADDRARRERSRFAEAAGTAATALVGSR